MTCPLCRHETTRPFTETTSFGYAIRYVECLNCGLIHQPSGETEAADPTFYEETYRKVYQSDENPTAKDLSIQEMRANHLVEYLQAIHPITIQNALDIGASAGVLLDTYKKAYACETTGVEPGNAYREFSVAKGHTMFTSFEELVQSKPSPYQLVSLIHVVEHLEDPVGMLRSIRENILGADGLLLLEVPNFYAHDSYELAHLACYTPHTLQHLVRKAGFEIVAMKTHGFPRSDVLGLYLTLLAKPAATQTMPPMRAEARVKIKRQVSMLYRKILQKLMPNRAWLPLPKPANESGNNY